MKIELIADRISGTGPKASDGSYQLKLDLGEYMRLPYAQAIMIEPGHNIKVTIEVEESNV